MSPPVCIWENGWCTTHNTNHRLRPEKKQQKIEVSLGDSAWYDNTCSDIEEDMRLLGFRDKKGSSSTETEEKGQR